MEKALKLKERLFNMVQQNSNSGLNQEVTYNKENMEQMQKAVNVGVEVVKEQASSLMMPLFQNLLNRTSNQDNGLAQLIEARNAPLLNDPRTN